MLSVYELLALVATLFFLSSFVKILNEWERLVIIRFGQLKGMRGPGLTFLLPMIEKGLRVDTRTIACNVPEQSVITSDSAELNLGANVYYRVTDPQRAVTQVENHGAAMAELAQSTLRSVISDFTKADLLNNQEEVAKSILKTLESSAKDWGIQVSVVELKPEGKEPVGHFRDQREAQEFIAYLKKCNIHGEFNVLPEGHYLVIVEEPFKEIAFNAYLAFEAMSEKPKALSYVGAILYATLTFAVTAGFFVLFAVMAYPDSDVASYLALLPPLAFSIWFGHRQVFRSAEILAADYAKEAKKIKPK